MNFRNATEETILGNWYSGTYQTGMLTRPEMNSVCPAGGHRRTWTSGCRVSPVREQVSVCSGCEKLSEGDITSGDSLSITTGTEYKLFTSSHVGCLHCRVTCLSSTVPTRGSGSTDRRRRREERATDFDCGKESRYGPRGASPDLDPGSKVPGSFSGLQGTPVPARGGNTWGTQSRPGVVETLGLVRRLGGLRDKGEDVLPFFLSGMEHLSTYKLLYCVHSTTSVSDRLSFTSYLQSIIITILY